MPSFEIERCSSPETAGPFTFARGRKAWVRARRGRFSTSCGDPVSTTRHAKARRHCFRHVDAPAIQLAGLDELVRGLQKAFDEDIVELHKNGTIPSVDPAGPFSNTMGGTVSPESRRVKNDPRSHGLWERTAPPGPPSAPLTGAIRTSVLVIGAGFTGLSAALHLAEAGTDVVVLEGEEVGFGGSGRNVGLVNAGMWVMPDDLPGVLGPLYGDRLLLLLGQAPKLVFELVAKHMIDCEIEASGTLHCAVGETGLREIEQRAAQWQRRGAPVELLDREATARVTGSPAYAGALLDRRAGTIQPLAYVRGLASAAHAAGARIHTGSRVSKVERAGSRWLVGTAAGSVEAEWIVMATNAYTVAPWPEVRAELVHFPYFNVATAPLSDNLRRSILPERQGAWDTQTVLSSFRMDAAGRLIYGSVGALRGTGQVVHPFWAQRSLRKLFPQLGDITFEAEWYGQIGMTSNSLPRFHRLAPQVVGFSGYNGRGIAPGTVFGRELARLVLGQIGETDLPLPVTDPAREPFRHVKEACYEVGAQAIHLKQALL